MSLRPWTVSRSEEIADMRIFRLLRETAVSPRTGEARQFARLVTPEWVNIVPLTPRREVILVRQWRHGVRRFTLEIPGGLVDPGETPSQAAARETREETGFIGDRPQHLGVVDPNPAINTNRCHTFLVENCHPVGKPHLDPSEDIEVILRPLAEIPTSISHSEITHALVICGFAWLWLARPDLLS